MVESESEEHQDIKMKHKKIDRSPGIYLIASHLDGVHYVGGTKDYYGRWRSHRSGLKRLAHSYTKHFVHALNANKLSFFLLDLDKREQFWMDQFPNRVNKNPNATAKGRKHTIEARRKNSQAHLGKIASPQTKAKISKSLIGNVRGRGSMGRKHTPETIEKMRKAATGRKLSTETKIKVGKSKIGNLYNLGRKHTADARKKMSKAHKGHKASPETRRKMSRAHKAFWAKRNGN
jgi:hypothetical protein